jgi:hypothetical protein
MSILSVSTIQSSNTTSDLTIRASNTGGSEIVLYANGDMKLQTFGTVNTGGISVNIANIATLTVNVATVTTANITTANVANVSVTTANITTANVANLTVTTANLTTANVANLSVTALRAGGNTGTAGQILSSNGTGVVWTTPGGGSNFNTSISQQVGFAVTTVLSSAFTVPSTAGFRYIIHSIHATNIGATTTELYVELEGTEYANTALAGDIPFLVGTSLELLRRPKVLYPNDRIKTRASQNSAMHVLITYEISSDTNLFGDSFIVTTGNTTFDAYTATGNSVIESIQLVNYSNVSYRDVTVRTVWVNAANAVQGYFTYDQNVPARAVIEALGAPKVLPSGHKIQIRASEADSLDMIISGKLI